MRTRRELCIAATLTCLLTVGACDSRGTQVDEHDHSEETAGADGHLDEKDGAHDESTRTGEPDEHGEEGLEAEGGVMLSEQQLERIGLKMQAAGPAVLGLDSSFPGEVTLVPDRVTHVVPQAPGIVRETLKTIGDRVQAGETLACIESSELAEAKLAFFAAASEIGCCQIALPRAREIFQSVGALLRVLDEGADPEAIASLDGKEMGEWRGRLLSAQAELDAAKSGFEREQSLRSRKVTSETALISATATYARSRALLAGEKDTARYSTLVSFSEEARKRQIAELALAAAENRMRVLGVEETWIERLNGLVPKLAMVEPCACTEPDCKEGEVPSILEALKGEPDLGRYCMQARQSGIVTEKHLSLGERVTGEEGAFVIVSTDRVWVRFNVYQKDLARVREGADVLVSVQGTTSSYPGTIAFISPVVDERTRTVTARVELDNPEGNLRPGLFVSVTVVDMSGEVAVAVPQAALQVIDQREVVIIAEHGGYLPIPVETGRNDGIHVEILSGLEAGTPVVTRGAFDIKAMIVTSRLGSHAGHGH